MSSKSKKSKLHKHRDPNARALIGRNGDGAHTDKRREQSRQACRGWQHQENFDG